MHNQKLNLFPFFLFTKSLSSILLPRLMTHQEIIDLYRNSSIDALLAEDIQPASESHLSAVFRRAADAADQNGHPTLASLHRLLSAILLGRVNPNDPALSYEPFFISEDRRVPPPELNDEEIGFIEGAIDATSNPVVKARLLDVAWLARKKFPSCIAAVTAYFEAADINTGIPFFRIGHFRRGVGLARGLGWQHRAFVQATERLLDRTRQIAQRETRGFFACHMFQIVKDFSSPEQIREFIEPALGRARAAHSDNEFNEEEQYLLVAASMQHKISDEAGEKSTRALLGECFVARAEQESSRTPPQYMAASHWMSRGIEQLQRLPTPPERLTQLRIRFGAINRGRLTELKPIPFPRELSDQVEQEHLHNREVVRSAVSGHALHEALMRLASVLPLCSVAAIRESVSATARVAPLQALVAADLLDARGRTQAVAGAIAGTPEDTEAAVMARAYRHAVQWKWNPRADLIAFGVEIILAEHVPLHHDLLFMADASPWVVEGHEEIVIRGFLSGLYGDWLLAAHLLVPQFEASIRSIMERAGVIVATLEDGVEEDKTLGALLGRPECAQLTGPDMVFELRGLLIEKTGLNLRNKLAHGLVTSNECYSSAAVLAWWLMLRLCCTPIQWPAEPIAPGPI